MDIQGVSAACALDWLAGKFFVGHDILTSRGIVAYPKEVVFVNHIGSDKTAGLKRIRQLGDGGCTWIVAHVVDDKMRKALENRGMTVQFTETIIWGTKTMTGWRMYGSPAAFKTWLASLDNGLLTL